MRAWATRAGAQTMTRDGEYGGGGDALWTQLSAMDDPKWREVDARVRRRLRSSGRGGAWRLLGAGGRGPPLAAIIPGDSVAEQVLTSGALNFLNLYNFVLVVRVLLTWFPNPPGAIIGPVSTLSDPYLNLFRGIIPPIGGTIDLSPVLAFLTLNVFTNAAEALPCELPAGFDEASRHTAAAMAGRAQAQARRRQRQVTLEARRKP